MFKRILTISKPYVASAYRGKLLAMAKIQPESKFGLICPPAWGSQVYEANSYDSIWIRKVPIYFNGKNHFHWYKNLRLHIEEFSPDFLNVEEEHYSLVTWQCLQVAKQLKIPMSFYTWQNIYKKYPPPFSWIEQSVFDYCRLGFAGNAEARDVLRRKGFNKAIAVIPQMGVDPTVFFPRLKDQSKEEFTFAFVGRFVEEKGIQTLLEATVQITSERHFKIVLLGSGPYQEKLEQMVAHLGIGARVVFMPPLLTTQIADFMRALDCLVLPSLTRKNWKEQFGRVLVEAMSCGVPVIGSDSGEIPTVIGNAGLVFAESDAGDLAGKMRRILHEPGLWGQLSERARERVRSHFTHDLIAKNLLDAISPT